MNSKHLIGTFALFIMGFFFLTACSDDEKETIVYVEPEPLTEKLLPPENVTCITNMTHLHFDWSAVTNATSYEASLTVEATNALVGEVETENTYCDFNGLEASTTYVFSVRAVYSENTDLNSEYAEITASTSAVEKLEPPTNLVCSEITYSSVTLTWDAAADAASYRVTVENGDGDVAATEVVTVCTCTIEDLAEETNYTAMVQSLVGNGSEESEFDSDPAYVYFSTGSVQLTAPTLSVYYIDHGMAVVEWDLSDEALEEQTVGSNDTYDLRIKDAGGNVLREVSSYDHFNFDRYPCISIYHHFRFVWGGLSASTKYTVEMRRVSTADTHYLSSKWGSVTFTTEPEPDTSGYLVYWDFQKVPFASNPMYWAYGLALSSTSDSSYDYDDPFNVPLAIPSGSNTVDTQGFTSISGSYNQSFIDNFLPGILTSDFSGSDYPDKLTSNIAVGVGFFKFGGSSLPSWIALPPLTDLSGSSNIVLDFDACPYYEPGNPVSTSHLTSHANADEVKEFYVVVPSGCTITSTEGEKASSDVIASDGLSVKLVNVTGDEMYAEGHDENYRWTNHKVNISGATSDTRITIYTATTSDGSQHRMWMSNVKIYKAN